MMDYIKPFFTYKGKMTRLPYALGVFLVIPVVAAILVAVLSITPVLGILSPLVGIIATVVVVFATIQRLRDINWSLWWALLLLIPAVQLGFMIVIAIKK